MNYELTAFGVVVGVLCCRSSTTGTCSPTTCPRVVSNSLPLSCSGPFSLGVCSGGGVLSLPFALRRSGIVVGALLLILTAIATDFSVFTLVSCSRRSGASTYEAVADKAFGRRAKLLCMGLVRWTLCNIVVQMHFR